MNEQPGTDPSQRPGLSSELQRSHRLSTRFCLLELQFANAILDHADLTRAGAHHGESVARARSVREGLVRILDSIRPNAEEAKAVEVGLAQLDLRLAEEDARDTPGEKDGKGEPRDKDRPGEAGEPPGR